MRRSLDEQGPNIRAEDATDRDDKGSKRKGIIPSLPDAKSPENPYE